ncbi:hypothetical protein D3C76_1680460 [compost metagenome]
MNIDGEEIIIKNFTSIEKLTKILAYIDDHIEHNITIHELAEIVHMLLGLSLPNSDKEQ